VIRTDYYSNISSLVTVIDSSTIDHATAAHSQIFSTEEAKHGSDISTYIPLEAYQ